MNQLKSFLKEITDFIEDIITVLICGVIIVVCFPYIWLKQIGEKKRIGDKNISL